MHGIDDRVLANEAPKLAASRTRLESLAAAAIFALLGALCCTPLMQEGWFTSHERIRPIARAFAAYLEVADGDLYPRWLALGYLGKGVPLFDFYPPAFSLLVAWAHALGVPLLLAAKLIVYGLFFIGAFGVYAWVRPHLGYFPALLAGILHLFAPYHFVDLYVRGATAEFAALAALPVLFLAIDGLVERSSAGGLAALAFACAAIVLSHILGALMIAPFAALYALVRSLRARARWNALGRIVAGGALGATLSAFYWLPALSERDALSSERAQGLVNGYYSPFVHFVHPIQWLDPRWGFGDSAPDPYADGMSFQLGLVILAACAASALVVWWLPRARRGFVLLGFALGAAALLLTTSASRPLYAALEPLQLVQFPWRFLGPATLFFSAAGAGCVSFFADRRPWLAASVVALLAAAVGVFSAQQRAVSQTLEIPDDRASIESVIAAGAWSTKFGSVNEYLPAGAAVEAASANLGSSPWGIDVDIANVRAAGRTDLSFDATASGASGIAVVPWYRFPGWKVSLDGGEIPLVPEPKGLIAFRVPQGLHVARVRFGTTPPRVIGWILCCVTWVGLGALMFRELRIAAAKA
jgi:hypothetical protein